ncbi:MAG: ABC transporter ATP-binding protein [Gammaproteobacteria bacterium]|nr:ABC transporter ATP-binding protein [Gammaproteobacteria bacterium]
MSDVVEAEPNAVAATEQPDPAQLTMLHAFWKCRRYLIPQWPHFAALLLLVGVTLALNTGIALFSSDLLTNKIFLAEPLTELQAQMLGLSTDEFVYVESLAEASRFQLRTIVLILLGSIVVFHFALSQGMGYYQTWILQRVNQHLREEMVNNAMQLSLRFHHKGQVGDAIYRVYQDSAMVVSILQTGIIQPIILIGSFLFVLTVIAAFNLYLATLFLVASVPAALLAKFMTSKLRKLSRAARLANSALTSHIQESIQGSKLLKALNAERGALTKFMDRSQHALDRAYVLRRTVVLLNLGVFFCAAVVTLIADYFMVQMVWNEDATAGYGVIAVVGFAVWNLGAFQAAREHMNSAGGSLVGMAFTWSVLQDMGVGLQRAMFLLELEPEVQDAADARDVPGAGLAVVFDHVAFQYEPTYPVLRDVSFEAKPGTVTAIVGSSGAGKSTLMNLLIRLYDVDQGSIKVNGVDVRELRQESLRNAVSIVLQENALFPTSIEENVRFAAPEASDAALQDALRISCVDEFLDDLPDGLHTELGERGAKLSTGQRQRISIARAIVKNGPILVLDEPTASLDVKTEQKLLSNIDAWAQDKIVFLITHRVATATRADQVVFLEDGYVAEVGPPNELLALAEGRYRAFVEAEASSQPVAA